jgi:antitoxin (DNA-binding transcriptional repressor) of toxin-antitoxin stability system
MRQVQLPEEERQFAALVSQAEAGEILTILRGGKPVAQLIPVPPQRTDAEREEARKKLIELMNQGVDLGGLWNGRDELYDRAPQPLATDDAPA